MPTYEYSCKSCGHQLESFQSMKDDPLSRCPQCGQETLKRLLGRGAGIIFKGSGFYETDYKKESGKKPAEPAPEKPAEKPAAAPSPAPSSASAPAAASN